MPKEKTTTELYEFMQENMATREELNFIKDRMATKEDIKDMATKGDVKKIVGESESRLGKEMGEMKTELKDYIDEKLSDLKGDIVVLMRKEDHKVLNLIKILREKNVLADSDVKQLLQMEPFSKMSL